MITKGKRNPRGLPVLIPPARQRSPTPTHRPDKTFGAIAHFERRPIAKRTKGGIATRAGAGSHRLVVDDRCGPASAPGGPPCMGRSAAPALSGVRQRVPRRRARQSRFEAPAAAVLGLWRARSRRLERRRAFLPLPNLPTVPPRRPTRRALRTQLVGFAPRTSTARGCRGRGWPRATSRPRPRSRRRTALMCRCPLRPGPVSPMPGSTAKGKQIQPAPGGKAGTVAVRERERGR